MLDAWVTRPEHPEGAKEEVKRREEQSQDPHDPLNLVEEPDNS